VYRESKWEVITPIAKAGKAHNMNENVELIPSEWNESALHFRVLIFLGEEKEEVNSTVIKDIVCTTVLSSNEPLQPDKYGRRIVSEDKLRSATEEMHEHEEAQSKFVL